MLFGLVPALSPLDPLGMTGATLFVLGVALAAGSLATLRAMRVEPIVTLRYD